MEALDCGSCMNLCRTEGIRLKESQQAAHVLVPPLPLLRVLTFARLFKSRFLLLLSPQSFPLW